MHLISLTRVSTVRACRQKRWRTLTYC